MPVLRRVFSGPWQGLVASGRGAQLGIFIKGYQALESSRSADTVVLDKTGTVTTAGSGG
jgi:cation-transporting P-type ATPase A/B/Cu+-exporting ATPase